VSKQWFAVPQTFGIEIAEGQDDALLIAISACLDEMSERRLASFTRCETWLIACSAIPPRCPEPS
jgi:hypothetical protein